MTAKTKILIDCDPGHDDAVAILFAAHHLDLVGVTTVHGNNTVANTTRNALAVLELAGIDVPVAQGLAAPIAMKAIEVAGMHGRSGLDGATLPEPRRTPIATHAVDFIIETVQRHRDALVVALVGPQSNFATALKREPRLASWVREITIMGGSATFGNITPTAEFNVYADPEAAAVVFGCGAPIRMVGYNVTRQTGFAQGDIDRMRASGRRVAGVIADLMAFYLGRQQQTFGLTVAPMHDVCAVTPYVDPDLIAYLDTTVSVELAGTHTRGMTVCDLRRARVGAGSSIRPLGPPNARVAMEAQGRKLIERVVETLLVYP